MAVAQGIIVAHYLSMVTSLGIVIFAIIAVYFGIRNIQVNTSVRENYPAIRHVFPIVVSVLIGLIFGFLFIERLIGKSVVDPVSFGALFIRPIVLLGSAERAIGLKIKYYNSLHRIEWVRKLGGFTWTKKF